MTTATEASSSLTVPHPSPCVLSMAMVTMAKQDQQETHPDSPTCSASTGESSLDEDCQLHERLGRVLSESDVEEDVNDDEDGDYIGDSTELLTSPQRHLVRRPSLGRKRAQQAQIRQIQLSMETESDDELLNHLVALEQLNRLASMDSAEYEQRLLDNSLPRLEEGASLSSASVPSSSLRSSTTHHRGIQLLSVPLTQLSMSLHRLHSAVANLTREVDGHSEETVALQAKLTASHERTRALEVAVQKLHQRNLKLKRQAERDRHVTQQLTRHVQDLARQLDDQGFELMASKVQQHEIQLQLSQQQHQRQLQYQEQHDENHRERTDSTFSELNLEDDEYANAILAGCETIERGGDSNDMHHLETATPLDAQSLDSSIASAQTANTKRPTLFDEVSPTLRISMHGSDSVTGSQRQRTWSASNVASRCRKEKIPTRETETMGDSSGTVDPQENANDTTEELLTTGKNQTSPPRKNSYESTGSSSSASMRKANPSLHNKNPFAIFLGPRMVQTYSLTMVPPYNMQFVALPCVSEVKDEKRSSDAIESATCDEGRTSDHVTSSSLLNDIVLVEAERIKGDDGSVSSPLDTAGTHADPVPGKEDVMFAVCGFREFDADVNFKPTLGARLVAINGVNVNSQWTLDELYEALDIAQGQVDDGGSRGSNRNKGKTLAYRNEDWNNEQNQVLKEAIKKEEKKLNLTGSEQTISNGDIGTTNSVSLSAKRGCDDDKPFQHFLRSRTASGDNVGKALNGIGNFFHNLHQQHDKTSTVKRTTPVANTEDKSSEMEEGKKRETATRPGQDANILQETATNDPKGKSNEKVETNIDTGASLESPHIKIAAESDQDVKSGNQPNSGSAEVGACGNIQARLPGRIENGTNPIDNVMSFFVNVMNNN